MELASQLYPSSVPVSDGRHWNKLPLERLRKFTIETLSEEIAEEDS